MHARLIMLDTLGKIDWKRKYVEAGRLNVVSGQDGIRAKFVTTLVKNKGGQQIKG